MTASGIEASTAVAFGANATATSMVPTLYPTRRDATPVSVVMVADVGPYTTVGSAPKKPPIRLAAPLVFIAP